MVYLLVVIVLLTCEDVRVDLVKAHKLSDHVLQEALEVVRRIAEPFYDISLVNGIVDV